MLDFTNRHSIMAFIHNADKWDGYEGKNVDGEPVLVFVQQGQGMVVKTIHAAKPKWYECIEYDADGCQVSVSYEHIGN